MTGELNRWLHIFGYRPHIAPLLPLPPNHRELLAHYGQNPAIIIDLARYFRCANDSMELLYNTSIGELQGIQRNWIWHYYYPEGILHQAYPPAAERRILNRLFWDWQPYYNEPWTKDLLQELEASLGVSWRDLVRRYNIPSESVSETVSEMITIRVGNGAPLIFQNHTHALPSRPDLFIVVYRPINRAASEWCGQLHMQGA